MNILYVQNIFVPTKDMFDKNYNSIISLISYLKQYPLIDNKLNFAFGGWCRNEKYFQDIRQLIKDNFKQTIVHTFDKNYGKAHIVNKLVNRHQNKYKYMITCDSDMVFDLECVDFFNRMVELAKNIESETNRPLGILAPSMTEENAHWNDKFTNKRTYNNENISFPNTGSGIAGGCIMTSRTAWDAIGGYREMGTYAGDDAFYLLDCYNKKFSYQVADNIWIKHPKENDQEYQKWKIQECQHSKKSFGESVEFSTQYWAVKT